MQWLVERFMCCCVNSSSTIDHVGIGSDILGVPGGLGDSPEAALPPDSASPHFPKSQDTYRTGQSGFLSARDDTEVLGGMNTARSTASGGSPMMSPEEKEKEKARLQRLVKDFAKEAVTGLAVNLVNPDSARMSPHFFQMDRYLTVFSLKPRDGSSSEAAVQDFNVKDLTAIYKGGEVCMRAPSLGQAATLCVGLDTNRADRRLFFHFDEPLERDKFYTCLKILRMSVDINQEG